MAMNISPASTFLRARMWSERRAGGGVEEDSAVIIAAFHRHPEERPRPLEPGEPLQGGLGQLAHLTIRSRVNPRSVGDGPGRARHPSRLAQKRRGHLRMTVWERCAPHSVTS